MYPTILVILTFALMFLLSLLFDKSVIHAIYIFIMKRILCILVCMLSFCITSCVENLKEYTFEVTYQNMVRGKIVRMLPENSTIFITSGESSCGHRRYLYAMKEGIGGFEEAILLEPVIDYRLITIK